MNHEQLEQAVAALAGLVDTLEQRTVTQAATVIEQTEAIDELAEQIKRQGESIDKLLGLVEALGLGRPSMRPWCYLYSNNPTAAMAVGTDLIEWIDGVYLKWPDAKLPACWAYHPHAVESLIRAYELWITCYQSRKATQREAFDWVVDHRPKCVAVLAGIEDCLLAYHDEGGRLALPQRTAPLAAEAVSLMGAWAAGSKQLQPWPTPDQYAAEVAHRADERARHGHPTFDGED